MISFVDVADSHRFKFQIDKDARVYLQDKKGHTQASSLRFYSKAAKASQALIPLSPKAKPRDWRIANVTRMQPILFSFKMPWLLISAEPPCLPPIAVIRGWALELNTDDAAYEIVQRSSSLPAFTISNPVRIAETGKSRAFVLDEGGKEQKLRIIKKTPKNSAGP